MMVLELGKGYPDVGSIRDRVAGYDDVWEVNQRRLSQDPFCEEGAARNDVRCRGNVIRLQRV